MPHLMFLSDISLIVRKYHVHLFVFFLVLFIGMTLAHPAVLLNDEFITTNQLRQLHAGHQIIINEGKYGLGQDGNMSVYFARKSNILAYTLFLPVISMPSFWIIDIMGEQFAYLILVLWTIIACLLLLFINHFFRKFSYYGQWQWTSIMVVIIFIFFFINLYYYSPFSVDPVDNYPEILAIVFTNILLLALSAILIYEINRTIFDYPAFAFFGTIVCLFSSSYFLWATHCKDHILVLPIFTAIFLCYIRLARTEDKWYLPLAFLLSGLLAWARPELAIWLFLLTCGICGYAIIRYRSRNRSESNLIFLVCSPLFTLIGALPFFLNNYLITKNILLPPTSLYINNASTQLGTNGTQSSLLPVSIRSLGSIIMQLVPVIPTNPFDFLKDLVGIFFYPHIGSVSVFALTPIFLIFLILTGLFLPFRKIQFTLEERKFMSIAAWVSFAVFLAYAFQIHSLNTDLGIQPDVRYLSPMYIPLTVIGLILLKHLHVLPENSEYSLKKMLMICSIGLPLSLILVSLIFSATSPNYNFSLGKFFSLYTLTLVILTIGTIFYKKFRNRGEFLCRYLILLLCSIPFFWQVNTIIYLRSFSNFAGYIFWIPVVHVLWEFLVKFYFI